MIPALELRNVSKRYPGTLAVDCMNFDVYPGEVHALLGENGAGKSTLMKMIAGSFHDYEGEIYVNGNLSHLRSPGEAKKCGIEMIYQELSLAMPLSIAENILVGRLPKKSGLFLDRKSIMEETRRCLQRVSMEHLDPRTQVAQISQSDAQLIEIAKALGNHPKILVMDEPTSALSRAEVNQLLNIINSLKDQGLAIIYISHHLPEIFEVADRVTVMRDGKHIATKPISDVSPEKLVEMMIGRVGEISTEPTAKMRQDKVRLQVEHLSRFGYFHDVSFSVHAGEIVGIGGLSGAGRTELGRAIAGVDSIDEGRIILDGKELKLNGMSSAIKAGIAYLTENRKVDGLALRLSVAENVLATLIPQSGKGLFSKRSYGRNSLEQLIQDLQVYPPDHSRTVGNLSGGNQQKVLLAKWLAINPNVLILDEPTRGVDIGSKAVIHEAVFELARQGAAVLVISSDLPELVKLSDRVLIMRQGHLIGQLEKEHCSEEDVLLAANGEGALDNVS